MSYGRAAEDGNIPPMTPTLLQLFPLADPARAALAERFALVDGTTHALRDAAIARDGPRIDAVLTTGGHGLTAAEMDAMPTLRFVGAFGVGYEGIDLDAARARGSIVDTAALVEALASKTVAGAGLDVYEGEPEPPHALFPFDDVTITPHVAGSSPQAMANALALFLDNATRFFAGQAVRTPV